MGVGRGWYARGVGGLGGWGIIVLLLGRRGLDRAVVRTVGSGDWAIVIWSLGSGRSLVFGWDGTLARWFDSGLVFFD